MSSVKEVYYTPEEYLELERNAPYKSEYFNGRIYAMSGASPPHIRIAANVLSELNFQFKGTPCQVFGSDMQVKVNKTGLYTYPDVAALCDRPQYGEGRNGLLLNPAVLIEVLSPSTEGYDRVGKFEHYRRLDSLQEYVMIAQDKVLVEHFVRQGDEWVPTKLTSLDDRLRLLSIGCEVSLRDIYDKVEFPGGEA